MCIGVIVVIPAVRIDAEAKFLDGFRRTHYRKAQTIGGVAVLAVPTALSGTGLNQIGDGDPQRHWRIERQSPRASAGQGKS